MDYENSLTFNKRKNIELNRSKQRGNKDKDIEYRINKNQPIRTAWIALE